MPFAKRMNFSFSSLISGTGLLCRFKPTKANSFPIFHYLCCPVLGLAVPTNASVTGFISGSHSSILEISRFRNVPQVVDGVVCPIPVNVVDTLAWKNAVCVEPCKSVRTVEAVIDSKNNVSATNTRLDGSCSESADIYKPRK